MYPIPPRNRESIDVAINADRPDLFGLAHKLHSVGRPRWNAWITDYSSAHFLRRFLSQVLLGTPDPADVGIRDMPIANSRIHDRQQREVHTQAIGQYLRYRALAGSHVLLISEVAEGGAALTRLARPLLAAGVQQLDLAVLVAMQPEAELLAMTGADNIYTGRTGRGLLSPKIKDTFGYPEVHGFLTEPGNAHPQLYAKFDATYRRQVEAAYDALALQFYIAQSGLALPPPLGEQLSRQRAA